MDTRKINFLIAMQNSIDSIEKKEGNSPKIEKIKSKFYNLVEFERDDNDINSIADFQKIINGECVFLSFLYEKNKIELVFKLENNIFNKIEYHSTKKSEIFENDALSTILSELWKFGFYEFNDTNGKVLKIDFNIFKELGIKKFRRLRNYSLKTQVNEINSLNTENIEINKKSSQIKFKLHKPKETYLLLDYFSSNEGGIKNLTHAFNLDFIEYETFINQCKDEFEAGVKKYPNVPDALLKRIKEFAFSPESIWYIRKGKEKIEPKLGWSEPSFIDWYKTEKKHPWYNDKYKNEMIIPFRESIRVRSDSEYLYKLINESFNLVFGSAPICEIILDEKSLKHADFYTDVDNLGQAIFEIFSTIKDVSLKNFCNKIEVGFHSDSDFKILSITHINSVSTKKSDDRGFLGGNLRTIKKKLYGLCNYEIHASFPDGYFRKIILSDDDKDKDFNLSSPGNWMGKSYPIEEYDVNGFTHILKFY
jgi:hypothetical protein